MSIPSPLSLNELIINAIENGENPRTFVEQYLHVNPDEIIVNEMV